MGLSIIKSAINEAKKRFTEVDDELEKCQAQKDTLLTEQREFENNISIVARKRLPEIKAELAEVEKNLAWLEGHRNSLKYGYDGIKEKLAVPLETRIAEIRSENKQLVDEINGICDLLIAKIRVIKIKNTEIRDSLIAEIRQIAPICVPGSLNLERFIDNQHLYNIVSPTLTEYGINSDIVRSIYSKLQ